MKYKINTKLKFYDRMLNRFGGNTSKLKGYCGLCGGHVFNLKSRWAKKGLCLSCFEVFGDKDEK